MKGAVKYPAALALMAGLLNYLGAGKAQEFTAAPTQNRVLSMVAGPVEHQRREVDLLFHPTAAARESEVQNTEANLDVRIEGEKIPADEVTSLVA